MIILFAAKELCAIMCNRLLFLGSDLPVVVSLSLDQLKCQGLLTKNNPIKTQHLQI